MTEIEARLEAVKRAYRRAVAGKDIGKADHSSSIDNNLLLDLEDTLFADPQFWPEESREVS